MTRSYSAGLTKELSEILREESRAYEEFLGLLQKEREALKCLKSEEVEVLARKREVVSNQMRSMREKRVKALSESGLSTTEKLSDVVKSKFLLSDQKILAPLIVKLRSLVEKVRIESKEFNQVVQFSMDLVNGSISILWSASHTVNRSYGRQGLINQAFQPMNPSGSGSSLREA